MDFRIIFNPFMKIDFNKHLPYYLLLAFLVSFVILVFQSEGTAGGADDINHFRYARYSFVNPDFFFDTKAKTVFTLVCAPVAQLGYNAEGIQCTFGTGCGTSYLLYGQKTEVQPTRSGPLPAFICANVYTDDAVRDE
jgi:hypothetical protein